jgi:hypothetical protein
MVFEGFEERYNFLHRNFFRFEVDFEWKFREALWFEFEEKLIEFLLGTSNFDKTWSRDLYLHLVINSTLGKEFEVQPRNFLTWIESFNQIAFYFD